MLKAMKLNPEPEDPEELENFADLLGLPIYEINAAAQMQQYLVLDYDGDTPEEWHLLGPKMFAEKFKFVDTEIEDQFAPVVKL